MDLNYLNARIRAWKSELLTEGTYDELIAAEDVQSLINRLKETNYARDIEIAAARYEDAREIVEGGLKGSLAKTFNELWKYAQPQARVLLRAIFSLWEVYNLKAIMRARINGISPDDSISVLIPAGEMDESALKELNQQKDMQEIIKLLHTWGSPYARPIKDVVEQYLRERQLIIIELALDRFVHAYCFSIAADNSINGEIIKRFIGDRIDSINISMLLKLSGENIPSANAVDYFLEGGERIDKDNFLLLARSKNKSELLQGLVGSLKDKHWKELIGTTEYEDAFFVEEQLEELLSRQACRLAVIEPLSIALALCFIYKKIREIKNLRLILRAKIFEIPAIEAKRFIIV